MLGPNMFIVRLKVSLVDESYWISWILGIRLEASEEPLRAATYVACSGGRRKREQDPEEGADAVLHGVPVLEGVAVCRVYFYCMEALCALY